ncbi:MAG: hypothetical protein R2839_02150 [Thermomicrobiales bacterium]
MGTAASMGAFSPWGFSWCFRTIRARQLSRLTRGVTRIFRHAYSEGADYIPLMRQADALWVELGDLIGQPVVHRVGILEMDAPGGVHAKQAQAAGADAGSASGSLNKIHRPLASFSSSRRLGGDSVISLDFWRSNLRCMVWLSWPPAAADGVFEHSPVTDYGTSGDGVWPLTAGGQRYHGGRLMLPEGMVVGLLADLRPAVDGGQKDCWRGLKWAIHRPFQPEVFPVFAAVTPLPAAKSTASPFMGSQKAQVADHPAVR